MTFPGDGLNELLEVLPPIVRFHLEQNNGLDGLLEVVLDYGRPVEVRYVDRVDRMEGVMVGMDDLEYVTTRIGDFGSDNRAGIERTLHRISCIRNRQGKVIGLTCRVGRALEGTIDIMDDIVRSGQSILILGRPGVGKTTKLREVARVLADEVQKRVVIIDTSNEIAGDGDIPHAGIGHARRMQVPAAPLQHQVMIEAVENHMPEVIVIDEIGTEMEAQAARTIAERGVQLVGTAHGQTLENLMLNPTLADLIGGIQAVTLSDDEARRRGTQKTVLERKAPPTFDVVIELVDYDRLAVHHNVQKTVDLILRGVPPRPEVRVRSGAGSIDVLEKEVTPDLGDPGFNDRYPALARRKDDGIESKPAPREAGPASIKIFPYGIARTRLERAIREKRVPAHVCTDIHQADAIMAIRSTHANRPAKLQSAAGRQIPAVVVKSNTFTQIAQALDDIVRQTQSESDGEVRALEEVQRGIDVVLQTGKPYELGPQPASIRKMQHLASEARRLPTEAVGDEPHRRLRILPAKS